MPKVLGTLLKALGAVVGLLILSVGYVVYSFGTPLKTVPISSGPAGAFTIGETKEQILSRLPTEVFSPRPKPDGVPQELDRDFEDEQH